MARPLIVFSRPLATRYRVGIGAVVLAILALLPLPLTAEAAVAPAANVPCVNGVLVIGARGTDENDVATAKTVADALSAQLTGGTAVQFYELIYDAASLKPPLSYVTRYGQAVHERGVPRLTGLLREHFSRCSATEHIVLAGYSQGADVVAQAWDAVMSDGGMQRYAGHLDGLLLFGHPRFNPAQRDGIDAYSLDIGGSTGHGIFGADGVATWSRSLESQHLMRSWCLPHDPICDASPTSTFLTWTVHMNYKRDFAISAGQQMGRWLSGHYGIR